MSHPVSYYVRHETSYEYSGDVVHGHQLLHLMPRELDYQSCTSHDIHIDPLPTLRADGSSTPSKAAGTSSLIHRRVDSRPSMGRD